MSVFSNKSTKQIAFSLNTNKITITTEDAENITSAVEKIPCKYNGENLTIGYNANFLIEVLKQQNNTPCTVMLKNALSAAVFTDTLNNITKTTLLMPIRLND